MRTLYIDSEFLKLCENSEIFKGLSREAIDALVALVYRINEGFDGETPSNIDLLNKVEELQLKLDQYEEV